MHSALTHDEVSSSQSTNMTTSSTARPETANFNLRKGARTAEVVAHKGRRGAAAGGGAADALSREAKVAWLAVGALVLRRQAGSVAVGAGGAGGRPRPRR